MYDIDRPKFIFVSLLEEFIRETEHSLAYFFALLVFLLTFLLALFGRDVLYTGLVGVLCLLLIKMRDIIEGFRELSCHNRPARRQETEYAAADRARQTLSDMQNFYTAFDDAAITVMAKEFPARFNEKKQNPAMEKPNLLSYLQTCRKIIETVCTFFPDRPLQPETKRALKKMTSAAQKYMLHYLQKKYSLTKEQMTQIEKSFTEQTTDDFLFQTQLESAGIDESTAQRTVKIADILRKIRSYINPADREKEEKAPVFANQEIPGSEESA